MSGPSMPKNAARGRAPMIVDGQRLCLDCKVPLLSFHKLGHNAIRCQACQSVRGRIAQAVTEWAVRQVAKAVKNGLLPRVSTQLCVDCGHQAQIYEHRDYRFPTKVEPVCRSCNSKRGPAIFPHPYCAYGAPSPVPCELCQREQEGSYFASLIRLAHICRGGIHRSQARRAG